MNFAQIFRALRKSKNMTLEELGEVLGKRKSTLSSWENGHRNPKLSELSIIANYFGVSVGRLIDGEVNREF
uniref:helix-turn-helix domain-containing protein n=1 Tax=Lactococcus garvieae TaxID=1363 RepID=UPI00359C49F2